MIHSPWNSPGQNTGVGSLSLLQGIFPTQGSNPDLLHCRQILYQLSYKGSLRILEWIAYLFQGICRIQESNQGLLHCTQILYQLNYQGSPISYQESPQILYLYLHFNRSEISMSFKKLSLSDLLSGLKYFGKMDMAAFHIYVVRCSIILK